jgi:hypothetical protein
MMVVTRASFLGSERAARRASKGRRSETSRRPADHDPDLTQGTTNAELNFNHLVRTRPSPPLHAVNEVVSDVHLSAQVHSSLSIDGPC